MTAVDLDTLEFTAERQTEFAALSGDWNPLHVDPVFSRRTQGGAPVVHGMNILVLCLDALAKHCPNLSVPAQVAAQFVRPIYSGDRARIVLAKQTPDEVRVDLRVDNVLAAGITLTFGPPASTASPAQTPGSDLFSSTSPNVLSLTDLPGRSGVVEPASSHTAIRAHVPRTCAWIGDERVAALLCISRLVGMDCPGLYSLLATVTLQLTKVASPRRLSYSVRSVDDRLRIVSMEVSGLGVQGTVEALARHPPIQQPSIGHVASWVSRGEFTGQRALIIGGSRGIGEVIAKIVAAGGGHPIITYNAGHEDAERVAAEIRGVGMRCDVLRYDVRLPAVPQIKTVAAVSTMYYCATPAIFKSRTRDFQPDLFAEFLVYYVDGFHAVCRELMSRRLPLSVFFPSSAALNARPAGLTEYAMAKAAGEILCADLEKAASDVRVVTARLPRLRTDQTSTIVTADSDDVLQVLLPIMRRMSPEPNVKPVA